MRTKSLLAVGAMVMGMASVASADFVVSYTRTDIATGALGSNYSVVIFRGLNNGLNGTGQKMYALDVALQTDDHFIFRKTNLDPDNVLDYDVTMTTKLDYTYDDFSTRTTPAYVPSATAGNANLGTAVRPFSTSVTFTPTGVNDGVLNNFNHASFPTFQTDELGNVITSSIQPTVNPELKWNNTSLKDFRVVGAYLDAGGAPNANTGQGVIFAVAVVPSTATVTMRGVSAGVQYTNLGGEVGPNWVLQSDIVVPPVPEPATFGLLGLAAVGLLARRSRKA